MLQHEESEYGDDAEGEDDGGSLGALLRVQGPNFKPSSFTPGCQAFVQWKET